MRSEVGVGVAEAPAQPSLVELCSSISESCSKRPSRWRLTCRTRATALALRGAPLSPARSESRRRDWVVSEPRQPCRRVTSPRNRRFSIAAPAELGREGPRLARWAIFASPVRAPAATLVEPEFDVEARVVGEPVGCPLWPEFEPEGAEGVETPGVFKDGVELCGVLTPGTVTEGT